MLKQTQEGRVFRRLLAYLKAYKLLTVLALVFLLLTTAIKSYIPLLASHMIDQVVAGLGLPYQFLLLYLAFYLLQSLLQYLGNFFFAQVSYGLVKDMRHEAFANVGKLGMAYFDKTPTGAIVSRITNDTEAISEMFSGLLANVITATFTFSLTLYTMLTLDVSLTLLICLFLPLIVVLVGLYRRLSTAVVAKTRSLLAAINASLAESIEGIRVIQAFNQEKRLQAEFEALNQAHLDETNRFVKLDSLFLRPAMSLLKLLGYALLMAYFGFRGADLGISAGVMYAFIQYINRLFDPLIQVTQHFSILQTSMVPAGRVFALIDQRDYEPEQRGDLTEIAHGHIVFKEVSFSYDGKTQVLDRVSFEVKAGQTIAFVGATGSGKSSIMNVLLRFYDFQAGQILIDGKDIRSYKDSALRQSLGLVLQEPFLYHGTIKSNIALYQPLSDQEVAEAARLVDAAEFIEKLPLAYDEPVTERGTTYSTGQRQLLAFARTMARKPKVLILDEATANIDSETEQVVQASLDKMRQGRTTIAIAHRLSTIQDADCIYVLDKGRIIESGRHEELLALGGTYHKMYQLQTGLGQ